MDISIIGGADGPTSISVSSPNTGDILSVAAIVLVLAGLIAYVVWRKRR